MICEYCGKRFVKEAAFLKHHCKMMDRFANFDEATFDLYVAWSKGSGSYYPCDKSEMRMRFVKSTYYPDFVKLRQFQLQQGFGDDTAYAFYLGENRINKFTWCLQGIFNKFVAYRAQNENYALSVDRSKRYLESRGYTLETCPMYLLYKFLMTGVISKNIFEEKKIDPKTVFPKEWLENLAQVL